MTDAERNLSLRRLRFSRELEKIYQEVFFQRTLRPLRVGFAILSILMGVNFVKNAFTEPLTSRGILMGVLPLVIFVVTFAPGFRYFWKPFLAVATTWAGLYMIYSSMSNPFFPAEQLTQYAQLERLSHALILFMTVVTLLIRLPFLWSTVCLFTYQITAIHWALNDLQLPPMMVREMMINSSLVVLSLMLAALSLERYHRSDFIANRLLEEERAKSDRLLLNVLPESVAERLKTQPKAIADAFPSTTVLFADIVDFTPLAATMSALELVALLNEVFSEFDSLTEKYGLERIKTIGDAYMVAGGLPDPKPDHARAVAHLALDMLAIVERFPRVNLRIGIHTGPVVAGVIGTKRFLYDLWGDTVNVASRMESHGTPGVIMVTEACREALGDGFEFGPVVELDVKGKGRMRAFALLNGPK